MFGSVAAIRGRGRNVVYATAKRGLVSLYESVRQRHRSSELRVQLYQLGFLATNLTHGMRLPMPATDPAVVAKTVIDRLAHGSACWYLPRKFALIALLVRALPWAIYRRMRETARVEPVASHTHRDDEHPNPERAGRRRVWRTLGSGARSAPSSAATST